MPLWHCQVAMTRQGTGIHRSKLVKPRVSGRLVQREVFSSFAGKLVNGAKIGLVVAPAGYGKSTLLSQSFDLLASHEISCVWLSLDPDDNNPYRFFLICWPPYSDVMRGLLQQQISKGREPQSTKVLEETIVTQTESTFCLPSREQRFTELM